MWSHFKVNFTKAKIIGYCYHLLSVVTFSLSQSDYPFVVNALNGKLHKKDTKQI